MCKQVDCADRWSKHPTWLNFQDAYAAMAHTVFCLVLPGDSSSTRRFSEIFMAGRGIHYSSLCNLGNLCVIICRVDVSALSGTQKLNRAHSLTNLTAPHFIVDFDVVDVIVHQSSNISWQHGHAYQLKSILVSGKLLVWSRYKNESSIDHEPAWHDGFHSC